MSVRQGFLALLSEQPMHGYQLRQEFEARTGGTWPLNIGQAYTTLSRLERDGLVEPLTDQDTSVSDGGAPERFTLTDAGRAEVADWWARPVDRAAPARDELAIKLALAVTVPGVDVRSVVQRQRHETMRSLHDLTRLKSSSRSAGGTGRTLAASGDNDLAWSLVLDSMIFAAEAEVRWLDHVEATVTRAQAAGVREAGTPSSGREHRTTTVGTAVDEAGRSTGAARASSGHGTARGAR